MININDLTEEEIDALVQGVELGIDYNLDVLEEDFQLYTEIVKKRSSNS
jgi:hypothetical protein